MERDCIRALILSPYPQDGKPSGVNDYSKILQDGFLRYGILADSVGGHLKDDSKNNAKYRVGNFYTLSVNNTVCQCAIAWTKGEAKEVVSDANWDLIISSENYVPNITHNIYSALPKIAGTNVRVAAAVAHYHAQIEDLKTRYKILREVARMMRRPEIRKNPPFFKITPGYLQTVFGVPDINVAVSKATAESVKQVYPIECEVIPNGIDTNRFTPDGPKIKEWEENGKINLFATCRHDPRKGLDDAIQAVGILMGKGRTDIKLWIGGEGVETEKLKKLTEKLGLSNFVTFLGNLSEKDLEMAHRSALGFFATSRGGEGGGRTLLEAGSSGSFPIVTRINGFTEYGKKIAIYANPGDPDDIARATQEMIDWPQEEKARRRFANRENVIKDFGKEKVVERNAKICIDVFEHHPKTKNDLKRKRRWKSVFSMRGKSAAA